MYAHNLNIGKPNNLKVFGSKKCLLGCDDNISRISVKVMVFNATFNNNSVKSLMLQEEFEDTNGTIRIRKWKKNNVQQIMDNTTTENTRSNNTNPTKTGGEIKCSRRACISCSIYGNRLLATVFNPLVSHK